MAVIIGAEPNFRFRDNYIEYIWKSFGEDFFKLLISEGIDSAEKGEYEYACTIFRSVMMMDPGNVDALYCYGRACRDAYSNGEGEEYVGRFKAESMEAFEKLIQVAPDFDMGYYFLGYAYLNLGLYTKANLVWEKFMELTSKESSEENSVDSSEKARSKSAFRLEVADWMRKLEEPIKIEGAYNMVLSGKFQEGIEALLPYTEDERFSNWWPLWYYLGVAHKSMEDMDGAIEDFKKVLVLAPGHIGTMEELVEIYSLLGDEENKEKYQGKIELVKRNGEEFRAENHPEYN